jgi:hypothetical protein
MRTLRLARVAAEAEGLRLRAMARRSVIRIVLAVVALVFLSGTLIFAHIALWLWLQLAQGWTPIATSGALGGGDLAAAIVLSLLAARSTPGRVEREALAVRRQAWENATSSMALSAMLLPALRLILGLLRRRRP